MLTQQGFQVRTATPAEDALIAQHFYQMWLDNQVPEAAITPDWYEIVLQYLEQARANLQYRAFVAEVEGRVVGSAGGQQFAGLYPNIIRATERCDGYIWGVYVEAGYRGRGIATRLTQEVVEHLRKIGCTRAVLNASPSGRSVYSRLGFVEGNVMQLNF